MIRLLKLLLISVILFGCKTKQVIHNTKIDTVFIDRKVSIIEKPRIDTVFVELPAVNKQVVARDSSFLSDKYASTLAYIQSDGLLFHNLTITPQKIKAPVMAIDRIETKDSIYVQIKKEFVEVPVKIPIPKWKQVLMWLGVAFIALLLYRLYRFFKIA